MGWARLARLAQVGPSWYKLAQAGSGWHMLAEAGLGWPMLAQAGQAGPRWAQADTSSQSVSLLCKEEANFFYMKRRECVPLFSIDRSHTPSLWREVGVSLFCTGRR